MRSDVEDLIRSLNIPQLEVLKVLANSESPVSTTKELGNATSTASYTLGGIIAPLRRYKISNQTLVVPAGRDSKEGVRWQINSKILDKDELSRLLVSMDI